jgi:hypothetical protein
MSAVRFAPSSPLRASTGQTGLCASYGTASSPPVSDAGVPIEEIARNVAIPGDHNRNRPPQANPSRNHWQHRSHGQPVAQAGRRRLGGARDQDLVGAAGQPGHDLGDPGGVAWGRSLGCRPMWATATVKGSFSEPGPALVWRDDLRQNGGALDGVRAWPAKGKNFSFRGCIRRSMGHPPGPNDVYRRTRRTAASQEGCQFPADDKGKEISLLATFNL